jgi:phage terminase small subunit
MAATKAPKPPLNPKQAQFVREYIIDFNGLQSAIRAGYSKHTAKEIASRLLTSVNVQAEITKAISGRVAKTERTAEEVVRALWEMAELDIAYYMYVDEGGAVSAVPLDQIPPEKRKYINKIKGKRTIRESADGSSVSMQDETEYTLPEKKGTYELLARHYGILIDKKEIDLKQPLTINIVKFTEPDGKEK